MTEVSQVTYDRLVKSVKEQHFPNDTHNDLFPDLIPGTLVLAHRHGSKEYHEVKINNKY